MKKSFLLLTTAMLLSTSFVQAAGNKTPEDLVSDVPVKGKNIFQPRRNKIAELKNVEESTRIKLVQLLGPQEETSLWKVVSAYARLDQALKDKESKRFNEPKKFPKPIKGSNLKTQLEVWQQREDDHQKWAQIEDEYKDLMSDRLKFWEAVANAEDTYKKAFKVAKEENTKLALAASMKKDVSDSDEETKSDRSDSSPASSPPSSPKLLKKKGSQDDLRGSQLLKKSSSSEDDEDNKSSTSAPVALQKGQQAQTWPLIHTGNPESVIEENGTLTVITKTSAAAEYLLEGSLEDSMTPGQTLKFEYKILLQPKSRISVGFLNTKKNGWYGLENILENTGDVEQVVQDSLVRVVPSGETKASLVFRNYHLGTAGKSTFTIEHLNLIFDVEDAKKGVVLPQAYAEVGSVQLKHLGSSEEVTEGEEGLTVTTKTSAAAEYLLESLREKVLPGQTLKVPYKIIVQPDSKISLGFLNTKRIGWYGAELILGPGTHEDVYERVVPQGETETSIVFRNYHLGTAGQSTFTIKSLNFQAK